MMFNKTTQKASLFFALCVFVLAVSACTPAPKKSTTYTGASGAVTLLENDRESCTRSCNADFDRCAGTKAAQTPIGRAGQMDGVLGAQADCNAAIKSCLSRCKGR
ncbi:MAG TPA: hypothetical protein DCY07_05450 [Rhodospirillaceae bacterium]|nr:hypothetical protein [Rhodospirillaceae bacterium]